MFSYFRFRFQRQRRRLRREVRLLTLWTRNYINRHVWGKWRQLGIIRRLILAWWGLAILMLLALGWQTNQLLLPHRHIGVARDAALSEGGVGPIKIINPVLPESASAEDVSSLIFNGLLRYNDHGQLEPDLATDWQISADGKSYTFHLRHGVKWQDGVPFTSQDVAFTLAAIQNPDSRSPLANSWQGIEAEPVDDYTIVYHLPNAFPPFLAATTQKIVPRHLLESVDPAALRASDFNQKPIGTGPYKLKSYIPNSNLVVLEANSSYFAGQPKIKDLEYHWFDSYGDLRAAYAKRQILAFGGIQPQDLASVLRLPHIKVKSYTQPTQTLLILRNSQTLLADQSLRRAINLAIDRSKLVTDVMLGEATPSTGPLLPPQLGYSGKYQLPKTNLTQAKALLEQAGWHQTGQGRSKSGQTLRLNLVTRSGGSDPVLANELKRQLATVGIAVKITAVNLTTLEQSYIRPRNYDMLLFGYNLGFDPDVYAFWHSSQKTDPGLNLAVYSSLLADKALEGGRVNADEQIRIGKYQTFQQQWQSDVPAVPLFSQNYIYAFSSRVVGPEGTRLIEPQDRFYNIQNWTIAAAPLK